MYEMSCQARFDARYWMLGAGALGPPGYLLGLGIELASLASPALAGGFFTTSATWEALDKSFNLWPNLPLGLRGKAGGGARVTAGPKRPHLSVCPGPNFPLQGVVAPAWEKRTQASSRKEPEP